MKRNAYNTTLLALVAFCCLCSACTGDPSQATNSETETTEASITIEDEDEIITPDFSDESSGDILPSVEPTTSDADVLPSDVVPSDPLQDPVTASVKLGSGNLANGGFATGDEKYVYFVSHGSSDRLSIFREDRATGEKTQIYQTVPKENVILDSLNLSGNTLIFRENQSESGTFAIYSLDLSSMEPSLIADADISNVTVYNGNLFYSKDGSLVRSDLDGKNEKALFTSEHSATTAKIAFSIADDKIYFADPENFANGGMFFGKIYSMDLDGNNKTEIPADVEACNEDIFFTDGKVLFFFGNTESDGSGFYTCNVDGSGLDMAAKAAPTARNICGKNTVTCDSHEVYVDKDGNGAELLFNEDMDSAGIVLIGDDIYFLGKEDGKTVTKRISISGANETVLG